MKIFESFGKFTICAYTVCVCSSWALFRAKVIYQKSCSYFYHIDIAGVSGERVLTDFTEFQWLIQVYNRE